MIRFLALLVGIAMGVAGAASAAPIVSNTWDAGSEGWAAGASPNGDSYGTVHDNDAGPGQPYLQITAADPGGAVREVLVYETKPNNEIASYNGGNWSPVSSVRSVRFDFYADAAPGALTLYFTDTSAVTWYFDITGISAGWQEGYGANLDFDWGAGWYRLDGGTEDATAFNYSLSIVDEVGLWLTYRTFGAQEYRVDDFQLDDQPLVEIPEPGTWVTLSAAFVSLGIPFRRRVRAALHRARTLWRAPGV